MTSMTPADAAWVRENAWTPAMRKTHRDVPGMRSTCACEFGLTSWCQHGQCDRCHRAEPLGGPAGYVCGKTGQDPLSFPEPYTHPTASATGAHPASVVMFWLADRVCAWRCPHECHDRPRLEQGALFDVDDR